jgi:hypothetical protein
LILDDIDFVTKTLLLSRRPQYTFIFLFYLLHIVGKFFKIFTNKEEIIDLLTYIINHTKNMGVYPTIKETERHYEDIQVMVARERIQICLNIVHSGVDITQRKTSIDYTINLLPKIKDVSTTTITTTAAPASEQNNGSPCHRSSSTSSAEAVSSPPSNDNNAKTTKRTNAAAATNSSSTQITGRPTPMAQRLRGRKQKMNDVTSPSSNRTVTSSTRDNTLQTSTSSSTIDSGRKQKRSSESTTPTVRNDAEPKKKVRTKRRK